MARQLCLLGTANLIRVEKRLYRLVDRKMCYRQFNELELAFFGFQLKNVFAYYSHFQRELDKYKYTVGV